MQLNSYSEIFICDSEVIKKISQFRNLYSYEPLKVKNDSLWVSYWNTENEIKFEKIKINILYRTYNSLLGYQIDFDSIALITNSNGVIVTRKVKNSYTFRSKQLVNEVENIYLRSKFFDKFEIQSFDSTYILVNDMYELKLLDANRKVLWKKNSKISSFMGIMSLKSVFYNSYFSMDSKHVIVEYRDYSDNNNSIMEIACESGKVIKICDMCYSPSCSPDNSLILYKYFTSKNQLFPIQYGIFNRINFKNLKQLGIRNAFWIY